MNMKFINKTIMGIKENKKVEEVSKCLGKCDREFKGTDENGKPIVYCHGCGRDLGKIFG